MQRFTFSLLTLLAACVGWASLLAGPAKPTKQAEAELPPTVQAPLAEHLRTVNPLWAERKLDAPRYQQPVRFANARARIQAHLTYTLDLLSRKPAPALSPDQSAARAQHLQVLARYAQRGEFPRNHRYSYRTPLFVDKWGVHCAVGYLMKQDGQGAFCQVVRKSANRIYVRQIDNPDFFAWAHRAGFSVDELALIQPGYPPPLAVEVVDSNADAGGRALLVDAQNRLILGGDYASFGGAGSPNIVRRTTAGQWEALGQGFIGPTQALAHYNGQVYAGGPNVTSALTQKPIVAARWDGAAWLPVAQANRGAVEAFASYQGDLYLGGDFENDDLDRYRYLVKQASGSVQTLPELPNGRVRALAVYQGKLIVGGDFTRIGSRDIAYLAAWDGSSWSALTSPNGQAPDAPVYSLHSAENALYIGGLIDTADLSVHSPQHYDTLSGLWVHTDTAWHSLGHHIAHAHQTAGAKPLRVATIADVGGQVWFGGLFAISPFIGTYGNNLGAVRGLNGEFYVEALAAAPDNVEDLTLDPQSNAPLLASSSPHALFKTDTTLAPNARPTAAQLDIAAYPNPVQDVLHLSRAAAIHADWSLRVLDLQGRVLAKQTWPAERRELQVNTTALPTGAHLYQLLENGQVVYTGRLLRAAQP